MQDEFLIFKRQIAPWVKVDLDQYKPRQMERRIRSMMTRAKLDTLEAYYELLKADPNRLQEFIDGLTINVSEFFRNPEKFDELERDVLPDLLSRFNRLRIWSAGCSSGAELSSVAIVLDRLKALDRAELIGTDLDRGILERASEGLYLPYELKNVSDADRERYFDPVEGRGIEPGTLRLRPEWLRRLTYKPQNLLEDPALSDCHVILCRNVVIYFTQESKDKLYRAFYQALEPGGILFIGGTERILDYRDVGFSQPRPFFYLKPMSGGSA
ncbi:Chemotaxis protein methyltransferase [compost metagenome]